MELCARVRNAIDFLSFRPLTVTHMPFAISWIAKKKKWIRHYFRCQSIEGSETSHANVASHVRYCACTGVCRTISVWTNHSREMYNLSICAHCFNVPPACDRPIFMNAINHANFYTASNRHKETFFSFRSFHSFLFCSTFCLFSTYSNTIHCAGESLSLPFPSIVVVVPQQLILQRQLGCGYFGTVEWAEWQFHIRNMNQEKWKKNRATKTRELATRIWFPFSIKMDFVVNAVFIAVTRFDTYLNTSITNYEWQFISRLIPRSTFNICVPCHGNDFGSTTAAAGILVSR